ncbi:hypothetical protein BN1708_008066 [Verticillium longisporum]|uniref:Uncharacterized protein n=1 Tax=Verticillium longisporum TaxID=100787 RepID=A0A0G4N072_VERLO|nr:hypothetical protein BN1708_008066 [Verticillium longisporum]
MVDVMDSKHKSSRIKDLVQAGHFTRRRPHSSRPPFGFPSAHRLHMLTVSPQFLASTQGDLSNITAPPMFLAPTSVVEVGRCWAEHPAIFAAPALEPDPARRALLVLTHMLSSLRSQLYIAGSPTVSIKKPLNAFLGELFLASFVDAPAKATTTLVAEQVSHHPPITAMHDPWESKRAWRDVAAGLRAGDVRAAVAAKTELERAQREMRAAEADEGRTWTPLLFRSAPGAKHDVFHRLAEGMEGWEHLYDDRTKGVWRVDEAALATQRPFRGELTPLG